MERQFVVFQIAHEHYAVDIAGVREILRLPEITKVPHAPEFVEGIMNPRGTVVPVIDLHKRFGLPPRESSNETRVMVLNVGDAQLGAIVDSVSEVLAISEDRIEPLERLPVDVSAEYITGVAKLDGRLVILLDYEMVLGRRERFALEETVALVSS